MILFLASSFGMRLKKTTGNFPYQQWCGRILVLALVLCCVGVAFSQQPFGIIVGTVTDPTGATLSATTITVTNTATQVSQTVVTSATGDYSVPFLVNGTYTIKVEHPGFRAAVISQVVVRAAQTVRADIRMELGEIKEGSEISTTAIALQTDTAVVGTTIDSKSVNDLPLNGRTFAQLATLVPGVAPQGGTNIATSRRRGSIGTAYAITANGFADVQNNFIFDGVPAMDLDSYNFAFSPSIDAIAEFRVQTNSYSSAYGGTPGAHVDVVTKSGTNAWHGTLWEFNRNAALAARNAFSAIRTPLNRNQFGANLGGPIRKNKAFFFFNWESGRQVQGTAGQLLSVPPLAFRNGDFSSLLPDGIVIKDPKTGQPFLNNKIPSERIDPNAKTFLTFTPEPNQSSNALGANNFRTRSFSTRTTEDQYATRVDYSVSARDAVSARYIYDQLTTPNEPPIFGNDENINTARGQNVAVNWTHTWSSRFFSNVLLGWKGTIFLDEIAELGPEIQVSLLRVLQEKEFERVGGNRTIKSDVRVIAATNKDLWREVKEGRFRMDLFYRLNVFPVHVPPLRERVQDIPVLIDHFAARFAARTGKTLSQIEQQSLSAMQQYSWPGNIRELQNVVERCVILADGEVLRVEPGMLMQEPGLGPTATNVTFFGSDRKAQIEAMLRETRGKVYGPRGAAARLGLAATTLDSQIRSLSINKHQFR